MTEQDTPKMTHDEMIDVLKGLVFGTFDRTTAKEREALDMAISALSENKGEWIPVSERLPEEDKEVLIFTKDKEINKAYHTLKEWSDTQWEWFVFGTLGYSLTYSDDEVLAWQPLPEPYKEERIKPNE